MKSLCTLARGALPAVTFLLFIAACSHTSAADRQPICRQLASLWANGGHERYAIPFDQPDPDELIYRVDIDNDGKLDVIRALCGNGSDASCEMTASFDEKTIIEFALPASTRLLKINRSVYIANGVFIDRHRTVSYSNYMVHKLSRDGIELVCESKRS